MGHKWTTLKICAISPDVQRNPLAGDESVPSANLENVIVLSDEFFQEIMAHPIPTDLEAVKLLASAPAILDLFVGLSYRCFTAKGKESFRSSASLG